MSFLPRISRYFGITAAALSLYTSGCSQPATSQAPAEFVISDGKGDQGSSASIVRDVDLDSRVTGAFDNHRSYGMTFSAKAGAVLRLKFTAVAGADSLDAAPGATLDTVAAVYGPLKDGQRGRRLLSADDDPATPAGQLPKFEVAEDGEYLFVLSTWNDPGHGNYSLEIDCDGTDFQCRRPVTSLPCEQKTRYIVGGQTIGTETWDSCKVVLLETTKVAADAVLTINPGVTVQGNYLGSGPYGTVQLDVAGTMQAVGTAEAPVVFTSVKDGWKGIVLRGSSSTIQNAYVEKAEVGVTVLGSTTTLADIGINSSGTGVIVGAGSHDTAIRRGRIDKVVDGVQIDADAVVEDTVLLSDRKYGIGISANGNAQKSVFRRALVSGFDIGVKVQGSELEVSDSTIIKNKRGVFVTGPNAGVHPAFAACDPVTFAPMTPPATNWYNPSTWGRDPSFVRCDIVENSTYAVFIEAPELLVIESSNIRDNGAGITIAADALHPDSRISKNNIYGNGKVQVESSHGSGKLDISGNYWAQISDPELSASWLMHHSDSRVCSFVWDGNQSTAWDGQNWHSGKYVCPNPRNTGVTCSYTETSAWDSQYVFTGFSPEPLSAGPDVKSCDKGVQDERGAQGL